MKNQKKTIPEFKSEQEEHEFWATNDSTVFIDWEKAQRAMFPNLKPTMKTLLHRFINSTYKSLKVISNKGNRLFKHLTIIYHNANVKRTILLLIFGFFFSKNIYADNNTSKQQEAVYRNNIEETVQLKTKIQIIESYQDKLLSTVYWSLGTLGATAALLLGFSWFSNFRIYERDKNFLKEELKSWFNDESYKFHKIAEKLISEQSNLVENKLSETSDRKLNILNNKIALIEKEINNNILNLQYELTEIQYNKWFDEKVYTNALRQALQMIDISLKNGYSWRVHKNLDNIHNILKTIAQPEFKGSSINADIIAKIHNTLEKIGPENQIIITSITSILTKIRNA